MSTSISSQDLNFGEGFINSNIQYLTSMKKNMIQLKNCYNNIFHFNNFKEFIVEFLEDINENIDKFLAFLNTTNNDSREQNKQIYVKLYNSLKEIFDEYSEKKINQYIKKINELNDINQNSIKNMVQFDPPSINNFSDSTININLQIEEECEQSYKEDNNSKSNSFFKEPKNIFLYMKEKEEEKKINCYEHSDEIAFYYCYHCCFFFCKDCGKKEAFKLSDHNLMEVNEMIKKDEEEKTKFIKSFVNIFKEYLLKCNFIIDNKKDTYLNDIIKLKFKFPQIENENEQIFEYQTKFLGEINNCEQLLLGKNETNISINNNHISNYLLKYLIDNFNDILDDMKLVDSNTIEKIDNSFVIEEKYIKGKNDNNVNKETDDYDVVEEFEDFQEENEGNDNIYDRLNNKFKSIMILINQNRNNLDYKKIFKYIIQHMSGVLNINEAEIFLLFNDKRAFVNHFIKSKEFAKLTPKRIRLKYENEYFLYQYKLIIDYFLIKQCQIPRKSIDFKYNFITPNLTLNIRRGSEIYNPPYGWFGVGLNVSEKYNKKDNNWLNINDKVCEWANAYYLLPKNLQTKDIIKELNNIIMKNDLKIDNNFQIKLHNYNKRIKDKKIGKGYYFCPNINIAEQYTPEIIFNKKKYKIALMAKVLIKNIKEPYEGDFWIIKDKVDIRIYKILFKEIF